MPWNYQARPTRNLATRIREGSQRLRPFIDRRKSGRRKRVRRISCDLGAVMDVSAGGMRVRSVRPLQGVHRMEIWGRGARARVRAKVIWSRKVAFRRYEAGLRFLEMSAEDQAKLARLVAEEGGLRRGRWENR